VQQQFVVWGTMPLMSDDLHPDVEVLAVTQPLFGNVADSTLPETAGFPFLSRALAVSLLLHLLVLGFVLVLKPGAGALPGPVQPAIQQLSVSFVTRNPQRNLPPSVPLPAPAEEIAPEVAGTPALTVPAPADAEEAASSDAVAMAPPSAGEELVEPDTKQVTEAVVSLTGNPAFTMTRAGGVDGESPSELSPGEIRQAVSTFVSGYRQALTSDWLQGCLIEQRSKGVLDCPEQQRKGADTQSAAIKAARALADGAFASVTVPRRNAALLRELEQDSRVHLAPLMAKGGLLGEMATFRFHMNLEYQRYLGGNFNFGNAAFVQANTAGQADVRGNGNMAFDRGYLQPRCRQMPCVWNYTGFSVKPLPAIDEGATSFRVVTTIFGERN